ncbi:Uma2 family endonuclease [Spirulina subsalsa FACHB-351]|uniref:Uma2 family endonuclease n=1 Tax=Spirulina subsalsa FACHB-351 TaxID=234711 RepID=A0ABT3L8U2_9CYAN|nr:Uma2 family endonuclease [Spirulina subsalsa]MCW6037926.1 Uma2 family endonuclease [Spirulina subsalsa FACHB-351]
MNVTLQKLTFQDYLDHNDGTDVRYELVDGELIAMSLGTGKHGAIAEFLNDQFRDLIRQAQQPWTSKQMLIGVRSPRGRRWDTCRIPDVTVLMRSQWLEMSNREAVIDLSDPPPLLVVEVVSPSTRTDDYRSKRAEYGLLEIPEYWIVDPLTEEITICLLEHQFYDSVTYQGEQVLESPLFPDLALTAREIFNDLG